MKIPLTGYLALASVAAVWCLIVGGSPADSKIARGSSLYPRARASSPHHFTARSPLPFEVRAEAINKMPHDEIREDALRKLALEWAARNPISAEGWGISITDASEREIALSQIVEVWAATDPEAAIKMARRDHLPGWSFDGIVERWGTVDFSGALAWASAISPDPDRDQMLVRIFLARAKTDPAGAAAWVTMRLPAGTLQEEAVMSVLCSWLPRDSTAASMWVDQFPEGEFRDRAKAEVEGFRTQQSARASERTR